MQVKFIINLVFLTFSSSLIAQSTIKIEGHITDADGLPLEGVSVVIDGSGYGAATNLAGYYHIDNLFAGIYTIRAQYSGYEDQIFENIHIRKEGTTVVNFKLIERIYVSETIIVEGLRVPEMNPQSVYVIGGKEIQDEHAQTLDEILQNVPGITVHSTSAGAAARYISIRGSAANQVIVVLDGILLNDPVTGTVDLSQIPLNSIGEILILKGGRSSTYGSGAIGGVIELKSRKDLIEKVRLRTRCGSFGTLGIQPSLTGKFSALSYVISAEYSKSDENFPYTYRRIDGTEIQATRINSGFISKNLFSQLGYSYKQHEVFLRTNFLRTDRGLPGLVYALTPYADAATKHIIIQTAHHYHTEDLETHINLYYRKNQSVYENNVPVDAPLTFQSVPSYQTKYRVISYGTRIDATYKPVSGHEIKTGFVYNSNRLNDENVLTNTRGVLSTASFRQTGIWLHHQWHLPHPDIINAVNLNSNLRYDFIDYSHTNATREEYRLSPSIGLYGSMGTTWLIAFRLNWNKSFRSPTLADLFYQDYRVQGNTDLRPEQSSELSFGFSAEISTLEISATYYRQSILNLIHWQLGSFATWRPFNIDAELQGVEAELSWHLPGNIAIVKMSHNYADVRNRNGEANTDGKVLTYRPANSTKVGLEINFADLTVNYNRRMIGRRFVTEANTVSLPAYAIDDVRISYRKQISGFTTGIQFSVQNIFDTDYELIERGPMPGRTWGASLNIEY